MTKPSPVVFYQSEPKTVTVLTGVGPKFDAVRQIVWQTDEDGDLQLLLQLMDPSNGESMGTLAKAEAEMADDPILIHRLSRIAEQLTTLAPTDFLEIYAVVALSVAERLKRPMPFVAPFAGKTIARRDLLGSLIGREELRALCVEIPSNLEATLRRLEEAGIGYEKSTIDFEIDEGCLTVTPYLRSIGFELAEVLKARRKRLSNQVIDLMPLFMRFMREVRNHDRDCRCHENLGEYAVRCLLRGITDTATVVALSIVLYEHDLAEHLSEAIVIDRETLQQLATGKDVDLPTLGKDGYDPEDRLCKICGWVGERTSTNPKVLADEVRSLIARWNKMPITAE